MSQRIFQDTHGTIEELQGKRIASLCSLDDAQTGEVILLWLRTDPDGRWYRIFIDGRYCGIDLFDQAMMEEDVDEDVRVRDLSSEYLGKEIRLAKVSEPSEPGRHIVLTFEFAAKTLELVCNSIEGDCVLDEGS